MTDACACAGSIYGDPHPVSVLVNPSDEPFDLAQAKLRAGLDWATTDPPDPRDELMGEFIAAARQKVEQDTGLAMLEQMRDVFVDFLPYALDLPPQSRPLQAVTSVSGIKPDGSRVPLDPANYVVDLPNARVVFTGGGPAFTETLRSVQPWVVSITSGYPDVPALQAAAPGLRQAVGLLIAHYATRGRDVTTVDAVNEMPFGYEDAIAPFALVKVP